MTSNRRTRKTSQVNRRGFLKGMLAAGAATVVTPRMLRAAAPSTQRGATKRVNVACIGSAAAGTTTSAKSRTPESRTLLHSAIPTWVPSTHRGVCGRIPVPSSSRISAKCLIRWPARSMPWSYRRRISRISRSSCSPCRWADLPSSFAINGNFGGDWEDDMEGGACMLRQGRRRLEGTAFNPKLMPPCCGETPRTMRFATFQLSHRRLWSSVRAMYPSCRSPKNSKSALATPGHSGI
jgi:hypothetical protein